MLRQIEKADDNDVFCQHVLCSTFSTKDKVVCYVNVFEFLRIRWALSQFILSNPTLIISKSFSLHKDWFLFPIWASWAQHSLAQRVVYKRSNIRWKTLKFAFFSFPLYFSSVYRIVQCCCILIYLVKLLAIFKDYFLLHDLNKISLDIVDRIERRNILNFQNAASKFWSCKINV